MPGKKSRVAASAPPSVGRREPLGLLDTQEMMASLGFARRPVNPVFDLLSGYFGLPGLNFLNSYVHPSHNDRYNGFDADDDYYDCYDDDDDDDDDSDFFSSRAPRSSLEPHPQIRQLTEEEANQHAKELLEEEERRKARTERNKRKKMRKKEKKRLEKESAEKSVLPEEEKEKSDSENLEENSVNDDNEEGNETPEIVKTPNAAAAAAGGGVGGDICSGTNKEENLKIHKKEEDDQKDLSLNNSYDCKAQLEPDYPCKQMPEKTMAELQEGRRSKGDKKPNFVDDTEIKKKKGKDVYNEERPVEPSVDVLSKRSKELARAGFRLAACGQYEMAVKCFTDAIKYNPKEYKLFGNRSLCYERLQQYENALRDADVAISIEPDWIKGLFRKGKALCGLKRYYDASLIYKRVLQLEGSSAEAEQELKRAQVLHLREMGFTQTQSEEALKNHASLEEAVEALFSENNEPEDAGVRKAQSPLPREADAATAAAADGDDEDGEWTVLQPSRPRPKQLREAAALSQARSKSHSPTPRPRADGKRKFLSVWVGSIAQAVSYSTLHELFSRAGTVHGIKILLDQQCAFVNYATEAECDRAIQFFDGLVVEGCPLSVRHPCKVLNGDGPGKAERECFFWRTIGCTRSDCTFRHVPEHENIDRNKFTSGLGNF